MIHGDLDIHVELPPPVRKLPAKQDVLRPARAVQQHQLAEPTSFRL